MDVLLTAADPRLSVVPILRGELGHGPRRTAELVNEMPPGTDSYV
ncbi:hypothetical protein [Streptomyces sp. cmx-10-25]